MSEKGDYVREMQANYDSGKQRYLLERLNTIAVKYDMPELEIPDDWGASGVESARQAWRFEFEKMLASFEGMCKPVEDEETRTPFGRRRMAQTLHKMVLSQWAKYKEFTRVAPTELVVASHHVPDGEGKPWWS